MVSTARCYTREMAPPTVSACVQQNSPHNRDRSRRLILAVNRSNYFGLLQLVLEYEGWSVTVVDIADWLAAPGEPASPPDLVLLEAWPLHDLALARRAQEQVGRLAAPLVLLVESEGDLTLSRQLGAAVAISPLCSLATLLEALETAMREPPLPARAVGE